MEAGMGYPTRVLYAFGYRSLFKSSPIQPWFQSFKINRAAITKHTRLRTGHSLCSTPLI